MSKVDQFRANAAACDKKAEAAQDLYAKQYFEKAAKAWRGLAVMADRNPGPADPFASPVAASPSRDRRL